MAIDQAAPRSRRSILLGALGGAGAAVIASLGRAAPVAAADGDNVVLGHGSTPTDNAATSATIVNSGAEPALGAVTAADNTALSGWTGTGVGAWGNSGATPPDGTDNSQTGVYGFSDHSDPIDAGVWGDSIAGTGVVGTGDWGVYGSGLSAGIVGDVAASANGIYGFSGDEAIVTPLAPAGVLGTGGAGGGIGVRGHAAPGGTYGMIASASSASQFALYVSGKLRLSRSGRVSIGASATSRKITMSGVTSSSYVIATLQTSVSGCYVRNVACGTGYFTIYLSKAPGKTVYAGYVVVN